MESFVDFIESKEKTGHGLASKITTKLINDGLNIENCRGQGFDSGANMAEKYNGMQSKICQINELARFVLCATHSLNLIGFHAANVTYSMVTFFGVVQQIFVYFSGSTSRWERLNTVAKVTLKLHCETRWSSKKRAVSALLYNIEKIYYILLEISTNDNLNKETTTGAKIILKQRNFKFFCLLHIWNNKIN